MPRRRRSGTSAATIGLFTLLATITLSPTATGGPGPTAVAAVPPIPAVESAVVLANGPRYRRATDGTVYSPLDEPAFVAGHDNGQSAGYRDRRGRLRSFWAFGDTFLTKPNGDGQQLLANTGAFTSDLSLRDNVSRWRYEGGDDGPREFLRLDATELAWNERYRDRDPRAAGCQPGAGVAWLDCGNELAIWGGAMVADQAHRRVLAFHTVIRRYHGLRAGCTDRDVAERRESCRELRFDGVGTGVAVWNEDRPAAGWVRQTVLNPADPAKPKALWPFDDQAETSDARFETGMLIHGGFLYAYGCYGFLSSDCRLARVPMASPTGVWDRAAWRFHAGADRDRAACPLPWSARVSCAKPVPAAGSPATLGGGAAGTSVFWNPQLKVLMAVYSKPLDNEVLYRVAYRPEGPWSQPALLSRALPSAGEGFGAISYAAFAHPEYAEERGRVQYLTYVHGTGAFSSDIPVVRVVFGAPRRG